MQCLSLAVCTFHCCRSSLWTSFISVLVKLFSLVTCSLQWCGPKPVTFLHSCPFEALMPCHKQASVVWTKACELPSSVSSLSSYAFSSAGFSGVDQSLWATFMGVLLRLFCLVICRLCGVDQSLWATFINVPLKLSCLVICRPLNFLHQLQNTSFFVTWYDWLS